MKYVQTQKSTHRYRKIRPLFDVIFLELRRYMEKKAEYAQGYSKANNAGFYCRKPPVKRSINRNIVMMVATQKANDAVEK